MLAVVLSIWVTAMTLLDEGGASDLGRGHVARGVPEVDHAVKVVVDRILTAVCPLFSARIAMQIREPRRHAVAHGLCSRRSLARRSRTYLERLHLGCCCLPLCHACLIALFGLRLRSAPSIPSAVCCVLGVDIDGPVWARVHGLQFGCRCVIRYCCRGPDRISALNQSIC